MGPGGHGHTPSYSTAATNIHNIRPQIKTIFNFNSNVYEQFRIIPEVAIFNFQYKMLPKSIPEVCTSNTNLTSDLRNQKNFMQLALLLQKIILMTTA